MIFIRIMMTKMLMKKREKADEFAQEFLIPTKEYKKFIAEKSFDKSSIVGFAHEIGIHPSIVLGRLQKKVL